MPVWAWVGEGLAVLLGVVLAPALGYGVAVMLRRRLLARDGGTFELSFRDVRHRSDVAGNDDLGQVDGQTDTGRGWMLGLGRYSADVLECFRIFSLAPRPRRRLARNDLEYLGQRAPQGAELQDLYAGHVVIRCATGDGLVDLALAPDALTGFLSWIEAAPPGHLPSAN